MGENRIERAPGVRGLFAYFTLVFFTCESFLFLLLVILNPNFFNRPLAVVAALVLLPPAGGFVLALFVRLPDRLLSLAGGASRAVSRPLSRLVLLISLGLTAFVLVLPLTFPRPAASLWGAVLIPLLVISGFGLWKLPALIPAAPSGDPAGGKNRRSLRKAYRIPVLFFVTAFVLIAMVPSLRHDRTKVALIGIDGASWNLMGKLISMGMLPEFEKLVREGVSGPLASIQPCISPAVWTSISTGFLPESHGITNFNGTLDNVEKKGFWEILSATGYRVGIYRWLITWPPVEVNGFLVPNWLARDESTYPPQLAHLKRRKGRSGLRKVRDVLLDVAYGFSADGVMMVTAHKLRAALTDLPRIDQGIALERIEALKRRDYFIGLKRLFDVDYGSCVFDGVDNFSHTLWQYMEPAYFDDVHPDLVRKYGDVIAEHYRELDGYVADIRGTLPPDSYLLVISDHGFQRAGTVVRKPPKPNRTIMEYLDVPLDAVDESSYQFDRLFLGVKRTEGAAGIADRLERGLRSVHLESEGEGTPLLRVRRIEKRVERYEAVFVVMAREGLSFLDDERVVTPAGTVDFDELFSIIPGVSGNHDPDDGVFFFTGPGVETGMSVSDLSVLDIHPLILALYQVPIAEDIDGTFRRDLFEEGEAPVTQRIASYGDRATGVTHDVPLSQEALERMKALGYIE